MSRTLYAFASVIINTVLALLVEDHTTLQYVRYRYTSKYDR